MLTFELQPKFLSKEERAALALQRRAAEVEEKRRLQDLEREQLQQKYGFGAVSSQTNGHGSKSNGAKRKDKVNGSNSSDSNYKSEREVAKETYLGLGDQQPKKKRRNPSEKKFNFEWDNTEDTSVDHNPLYKERIDISSKLGGMSELKSSSTKEDHMALHWSDKPIDLMRERDWRIFKEDYNIATKGGGVANPIRNWDEANLPATLRQVIQKVGYTKPSPIQMAAIPIGLKARDIIGIAETGSGKTASFVIPMLVYISQLPPLTEETMNEGPYAIILAPTRELAQAD